jgi:hypothetical protein
MSPAPSHQFGETPHDLAKNDASRAALKGHAMPTAAVNAAAAHAPAAPVVSTQTVVAVPSDVAALLSQLSLSAHGLSLCGKLGVESCSDLVLLNDNDLKDELPEMKLAERRRLLDACGKLKPPDVAPAAPAAAVAPPPTFSAAVFVAAADASSLVALLRQLGELNVSSSDATALRNEAQHALDATGAQACLADAITAAVVARVAAFVQQFGVLHLDAAAHVAKHSDRLEQMWVELYAKFLPSKLPPDAERKSKRVLVIGPGFGLLKNPAQAAIIKQAGFVVHACFPPDPEGAGFDMSSACDLVEAEMRKFKPSAITSGSKGGAYVVELWRRMERAGGELHGWSGAAVMLNAHPQCQELPADAPVIIAHGAADTTFTRSRETLEALLKGRHSSAFLYYTAGGGAPTRPKDGHDMATLVQDDCLPRLLDAVISASPGCIQVNPEFNMARSWGGFLSQERRKAETNLGYKPDQLARKFWQTDGADDHKLLDVADGSDEFNAVKAVFLSEPVVPAFYGGTHVGSSWSQRTQILSIKRVENNGQEGASRAAYNSICTALKSEGVAFTGGVHSRWLFHGTDHDTMIRIVSDPARGFTPLARKANDSKITLWGEGIYFARDATYPDDFGFAAKASDGTKHMLLCLVMTGTSCLGGNDVRLYLKGRDGHSKYDSLVDSLSNPEIFVVTEGAQVCPAYAIQYV